MKIEIDPRDVRIVGGPASAGPTGVPFRYRVYMAVAIAAIEVVLVVTKILPWWIAIVAGVALVITWWELRRRVRGWRQRQALHVVVMSQLLLASFLVIIPASLVAAAVVFIVVILMAMMMMLGRRV